MTLSTITPVVLTYNEEPNLGRCLAGLAWAGRVVVLDSLSTDSTKVIAAAHANVTWLERVFDDHTSQWNFGVDAVETEWVLALDADYELPEAFAGELEALEPDANVDAFCARFEYRLFGRPLRGTLYPPRAVLFRKGRCRYRQDGHTQLLEFKGRSGNLRSVIAHDDRKPLTRWLASQSSYAELEARHLLETPVERLGRADRIRRWMIAAPGLVFFYTLVGRGLILDGWAGWYYALQRTLAELMLSLHLLHRRVVARAANAAPSSKS